MYLTAVRMAATAARAETSFLKLTRDRIPSVITVIKENIRQKTVRRAAKSAATVPTVPTLY